MSRRPGPGRLVATMLDRPPTDSDKTRAAARERRRRCRKRRAAGKILLAVEVDENAFVDALLLADDKYLPDDLPPDTPPTRAQLNAAAAAVLAFFIRRWK
jgi:hypothetical protein